MLRLGLFVLSIWAVVDLARRPAAVLVTAGVSRSRWVLLFWIVPFAEVYYLVVKRRELDAAAVRVDHREVLYDMFGWSASACAELLHRLDLRRVKHTVEGNELVIAKREESRVDRWIARRDLEGKFNSRP